MALTKKRASALRAVASASILATTVLGGSGWAATASEAATSAAAGLVAARSDLKAYSGIPKFVAPGPAFNATAAMKGKTIYSISIGTQDQFIQVIETAEAVVAKKIGFKYVAWPNTGSPEQWARGIETAINVHASLIDLLGINPSQVAPQIAAAHKAGIPVVSTDAYDLSQTPPASLKLNAYVNIPYAQAGRLMADWMTVATAGVGHALVLGSPEVAASAPQVAAIKSEFLKVCPKCVVKYSGITIANWATQTTPIVNAAILKDSKLSYVMPIYDSQSQLIISAIKTAGAQKRIHITSYDGTPFVLKYLEDGTTVTMDVGQNLSWLAYAFMDQDMRVLAKQAPVANENLPLRAFTSKNVRLTGTPPVNNLGYGNAYISNYYKLWNG